MEESNLMQTSVIITTIICLTVLAVFGLLASVARQANDIESNNAAAKAAAEMQKLALICKSNLNDNAKEESNNATEEDFTIYTSSDNDE